MYQEFFNLEKKPFQLTTDLQDFFHGNVQESTLATMHYGLHSKGGIVVICGEVGVGKTFMIKEFIRSHTSNKTIIETMVSAYLKPCELLKTIAIKFRLPIEGLDKACLLAALQKLFEDTARMGRRSLLIIDEAQNLSKQALDELRLLTDFDFNGQLTFQVFLVGRPELKQKIFSADMEQFKQRVITIHQINCLDSAETKRYMLFCLQQASWQNTPQFSESTFSIIHDFSQGIIRKINYLCDRLLMLAYLEELTIIDVNAVVKVIEELTAETQIEPTITSVESTSFQENVSLEQRLAYLEKILLK